MKITAWITWDKCAPSTFGHALTRSALRTVLLK